MRTGEKFGRVVSRMRNALMLGHGPQRCAPAVAAQPRRIVDRQSLVFADVGTTAAFGRILMLTRRPPAIEIDLGMGGRRELTTRQQTATAASVEQHCRIDIGHRSQKSSCALNFTSRGFSTLRGCRNDA